MCFNYKHVRLQINLPKKTPIEITYFSQIWKAIREAFENITIKGCAFHFCQAVFRKVTELGLKTTYSQRGAEYRYIRSHKIMALPFLPLADIPSAFDQLAPRSSSAELKQRVRYIDTTWISNPIWTPRNWSIYKTSIRTNNDVEGILIFCFIHPFSHPKKRNNKKFM